MLSLTSLEKWFLLVKNYYSCGSGRVGLGGRVVGWLDNLEIMINSVQQGWNWTDLGNLIKEVCSDMQDQKLISKAYTVMDRIKSLVGPTGLKAEECQVMQS